MTGSPPRSTSSTEGHPAPSALGGGASPEAGDAQPLLEVGRIVRPHGLTGEVVVSFASNRAERSAPGSVLEAASRSLTVVHARPHQRRHLVRFAEVIGRVEAEALRGAALRAPALDDEGELWVHRLVGAEVVTTEGVAAGRVVAVEANPASDLLVTDQGHLVPLVFVVAAGEDGGEGAGAEAGEDDGVGSEGSKDAEGPPRIVIDPPPGLLG